MWSIGEAVLALSGIVLALILIWGLIWLFDRRAREYNAKLRSREELGDDDMYRRYFEGSAIPQDMPGRIRRLFAEHYLYPAEKMLPDDDLSFLTDSEFSDWDNSPLIDELEREFEIKISPEETEKTKPTILAVTMLVAEKIHLSSIDPLTLLIRDITLHDLAQQHGGITSCGKLE